MPSSYGTTLARSQPLTVPSSDHLERPVRRHRLVRRAVRLLAELFLLSLLVSALFVRLPQVEGRSMRPGIEGGSHVLINTLAYDFRFGPLQLARAPVHRGDVVAFRRQSVDGEKIYLKRVIGLPGDELAIKNGTIYVNGGAITEAYATVSDGGSLSAQRIPAGGVFVMGDNRAESDDSRSFGPVVTSNILGKAVLTIWPLSRVSAIR